MASGLWREALSNGKSYYYNYVTHETTWQKPAEEDMEELPPLPPGDPPEPHAAIAPPNDVTAHTTEAEASPSSTSVPSYITPPYDAAAQYSMPAYGSYPPYAAQPSYAATAPTPYGLAPPSLTDFQPVLAPPPKPPPMLHPQQLEPPPLPPQPGQEEFYRRPDNWPGRSYHKSLGESIHRLQETPGNIRHDIIIEKRVIGRILGKGARDLDAMKAYSGCEVFIIDKHPPPGEGDEHRLLILIGAPSQVRACKEKVNAVLERARNELPPLPPPLSSGWRPIPEVGNPEQWDDGQRHGNENYPKRQRA